MRRLLVALLSTLAALTGCAATGDDDTTSSEDALGANQCSVLVVMSDAKTLRAVGASLLTRGQTKNYEYGYLLDEMAVPVRALLDAGCKVTFTNPTGVEAPRDRQGDAAFYFTDGLPDPGPDASLLDEVAAKLRLDRLVPGPQAHRELADALSLVDSPASPIRGKGPGSLDSPLPFDALVRDGNADPAKLSTYDAVFVPGGYAPMLNLWNDARLGSILRWFHRNDRLTVTLCRGGVALRSTAEGGAFEYRGYRMTTYATIEDDVASLTNGIKPLWDLPFHPNEKLREQGANVVFRPFRSHVVEDRDLITGENQFSAHALASRFVGALTARGAIRR